MSTEAGGPVQLPLAGVGAVVTGASRGIGAAVVRSLAGAGATVVLLARGLDALERVAAGLGGRGIPLPCDLGDAVAVARAVESISDRFDGKLGILVNNAGIFPFAPLHEIASDEFVSAVEVNLVAPFRFVRAFLPGMRTAERGHVVTIGSAADRVAYPNNGAYSATKFGARALHEVLRAETRGTGVRATLVSPGPTATAIWDAVDIEAHKGIPPKDRMMCAEDVASAVLYAVLQPAHVNVDELRLSRA